VRGQLSGLLPRRERTGHYKRPTEPGNLRHADPPARLALNLMDAMYFKGRILLLGGTASERRRARLDKHGGLFWRDRDPTGVKIMDVALRGGGKLRTPYGRKTVARRRAANRVAKQARKVNR
jgi:hypothetical protein